MDLEEGEILISDISSDSDEGNPRLWGVGRNEDRSCVQQKTTRAKGQEKETLTRNDGHSHQWSADTGRKAFRGLYCLSKREGERRKKRGQSDMELLLKNKNKERKISEQKSLLNPKKNDLSHKSPKSKKRKWKDKYQRRESGWNNFNRERDQQTRKNSTLSERVTSDSGPHVVPPAAAMPHGTHPLMNKLITAGLAREQLVPTAPLNQTHEELSNSLVGPSKINKAEPVATNTAIQEDEDSEIEVIIPPKKVPTVVTLDSDGEEVSQTNKGSELLQGPSSNITFEKSTNFEPFNLTSDDRNYASKTDKDEDALSLSESLIDNIFGSSDDASVKCLLSEEELDPYSPSSPSSGNSLQDNSKIILTKSSSALSPLSERDELHSIQNMSGQNQSNIVSETFSYPAKNKQNSSLDISRNIYFESNVASEGYVLSKIDTEKRVTFHNSSNKEEGKSERGIDSSHLVKIKVSLDQEKPSSEEYSCEIGKYLHEINEHSTFVTTSPSTSNVSPIDSKKSNNDDDTPYSPSSFHVLENNSNDSLSKNEESDSSRVGFSVPAAGEPEHHSKHQDVIRLSITDSNEKHKVLTKSLEANSNKTTDSRLGSSLKVSDESTCIKELSYYVSTCDNIEDSLSILSKIQNTSNFCVDNTSRTSSTHQENSKLNISSKRKNLSRKNKSLNKMSNKDTTDEIELPLVDTQRDNRCSIRETDIVSHGNITDEQGPKGCTIQPVSATMLKCNDKTKSDDEEDLSQLRLIALSSKAKPNQSSSKNVISSRENISQSTTSADDDDYDNEEDDVLQLRVAALKSAFIKKHEERKKRGLLIKKRKRIISGLLDDVIPPPNDVESLHQQDLTSEIYLPSSQQEKISPTSPVQSTNSMQGEEDMELADSDSEGNIIQDEEKLCANESSANDLVGSHSIKNPNKQTTGENPAGKCLDICANNSTLSLLPSQPYPPGVDPEVFSGSFVEQCQSNIQSTSLPPILPPPPPPSTLAFPHLPPPPPPPALFNIMDEPQDHFYQSHVISQNDPVEANRNTLASYDSAETKVLCPPFEQNALYKSSSVNVDPVYTSFENTNAFGPGYLACGDSEGNISQSTESLSAEFSLQFQNSDGVVHRPRSILSHNQLRPNLQSIPVLKNIPKKLRPKKKLNRNNKKKIMKNKTHKGMMVSEPKVLCITNAPSLSKEKNNLITNTKYNHYSKYTTGPFVEEPLAFPIHEECISTPLCTTNPHIQKSFKNTKEHEKSFNLSTNRFKLCHSPQELNCGEMDTAQEKSCILEEDIDLSEMIVLDEVGMSPEHKPRYDGYCDQELREEEEDENTLRVRALTSLSEKTIPTKPYCNYQHIPRPSTRSDIPTQDYRNKENYKIIRNEFFSGGDCSNNKIKDFENISITRRVDVSDSSKYRLTRVVKKNEPRRSVVQGRESLKVVIPSDSPPHILPQSSPPIVERFIINVGNDSDSEEDCEWMRKVRIQDSPAEMAPGPVVDHELERSIDLLLMNARQNIDKPVPEISKPVPGGTSSKYGSLGGHFTPSSKKQENNSDTPLQLLPKEKQEEYRRLQKIIEEKEREKLKRPKVKELSRKSVSPLNSVLRNETMKLSRAINKSNEKKCTIDKTSNPGLETEKLRQNNLSDKTSPLLLKGVSKKDTHEIPKHNPVKNYTTTSKELSSFSNESVTRPQTGNDCLLKASGDPKQLSSENNECLSHVSMGEKSSAKVSQVFSKDQEKSNLVLTDNSPSTSYFPGFKEKEHTSCCKSLKNPSEEVNLEKGQIMVCNLKRTPMEQKESIAECLVNEQNVAPVKANNVQKTQLRGEKFNNNSENTSPTLVHECVPMVIRTEAIRHSEVEKTLSDFRNFTPESKIGALNYSMNNTKQIKKPIDQSCLSHQSQGENIGGLDSGKIKDDIFNNSTLTEKDGNDSGPFQNEINTDGTRMELTIQTARDTQSPISEATNNTELLMSNQSELLCERFVLIDELTELNERLGEVEREQMRLAALAVDTRNLRRALARAEEGLRAQYATTQHLDQVIHTSHQTVCSRHSRIQHLETQCSQLGHNIQGPQYQIPASGRDLMLKKIQQATDKRDKIKIKREAVKIFMENPNGTRGELEDLLSLKEAQLSDGLHKGPVNHANSILQDPGVSQISSLALERVLSSDSELFQFSDFSGPSSSLHELSEFQKINEIENLNVISTDPPSPPEVLRHCKGKDCLPSTSSDSDKSSSKLPPSNITKSSELGHNNNITKSSLRKPSSETPFNWTVSLYEKTNPVHSSATLSCSEQGNGSSKQQCSSPLLYEAKGNTCQMSEDKSKQLPDEYRFKLNNTCPEAMDVLEHNVLAKHPLSEICDTLGDNSNNKRKERMESGVLKLVCSESPAKKRCTELPMRSESNSTVSKPIKSSLRYKSVLQYRTPASNRRVQNTSSSGEVIVCPYDLTGKCQDNQCKFQHFQSGS